MFGARRLLLSMFSLMAVGLLVGSVLATKDDPGPCSAGVDTVLLTGSQTNETCGTVEGRVQVCEEGEWRNLCDGNWTVQDAAVTCRSLNYSNQNAQNRQGGQIVSGSSRYGVRCNGSEETFADCDRIMENMGIFVMGQNCRFAFLVVCYLTDEAAEEQLCEPELTTDPLPLPTTTSSRNTGVPTTFGTSSPTPTDALVTMDATSQTSPPEVTDSTSFLTAPTLYYFIGGLSAIIVAAILLFLLTCCCCRKGQITSLQPEGREQKPKETVTPIQLLQETICSPKEEESSYSTAACRYDPIDTQAQSGNCDWNPVYGEAYNYSENPAYSLVAENSRQCVKSDPESIFYEVITPACSFVAHQRKSDQDSTYYYEAIPE